MCDTWSWVAFAALIVIAAAMTALAAWIANNEYRQKLEAGYTFTKGDQTFTPKIIMKLTLVAFLVALLSTIAGISPGLIFNSFLLQLDMHPAGGSATGMYVSMFTTMAATINTLINNKLNIPYALLISGISLLGTLPGLYGQGWIVKKASGRF